MSTPYLEPPRSPQHNPHQRYKIIELIGQRVLQPTDQSRTYLAFDTDGAHAPQCVIRKWVVGGDDAARRSRLETLRDILDREITAMMHLGPHDQIAQFRDGFELDSALYQVRDYVPGRSIAQIPPDYSWTGIEILHLVQDALTVLAYLHQHGLTHGNLHPSNLIVRHSDGRVVLTDFRLTAQTEEPPSLVTSAMTGATSGSASMQPVLDVYALGAIALERLTGFPVQALPRAPDTGALQWPDSHETPGEQRALLSGPSADSEVEPAVAFVTESAANQPTDLQLKRHVFTVLARMVSANPQERFPSAVEALAALSDCLSYGDLTQGRSLKGVLETGGGAPSVGPDGAPDESSLANPDTPLFSSESSGGAYSTTAVSLTSALAIAPLSIAQWVRPMPVRAIGAAIIMTLTIASCGFFWLLHPEALDRLLNDGASRLAQAQTFYEKGDLDTAIALAQSIEPENPTYETAQVAIAQWQQAWKEADAIFTRIEVAMGDRQWEQVMQQSRGLPEQPFWQKKVQPLIDKAQAELNQQGQALLQQAFDAAVQRNFVAALASLGQISPHSAAYERVPPKMSEYAQKRDIRAHYFLQQAFDAAQTYEFGDAIEYLRAIPPDAPPYDLAQQKIAEYLEKEQIRANYLLQQAQGRAVVHDVVDEATHLSLNPGDRLQSIEHH